MILCAVKSSPKMLSSIPESKRTKKVCMAAYKTSSGAFAYFPKKYRSLELAIRNGGINPTEIGYLNAHATSTHAGDGREAMAIKQIFGDYAIPVTSTKSQTGHEMWAAGAAECIYSMLMMKNDFIAGNINFEEPDEETACVNVIPETTEKHFDMFLSNSFGFGGTNSTLIVKNL